MSIVFISLLLLYFFPIKAQVTCPAGQAEVRGVCKLCPPGTFSRGKGTCIPCPKGTFQPFHGAGLPQFCRRCDENTFSNITGATSCRPCPPGQITTDRSSRRCRVCPPGSGIEFGDCRRCEQGFYAENNKCLQCPKGLSTPRRATSINDCKPCEELRNCPRCFRNGYRVGIACVSCPAGTFTRQDGATTIAQCIPCPAGTFYPSDRLLNCTSCVRGLTSAPGAAMCRNPRKPCPKGTFETKNKNCMSCDRGFRYDPVKLECIQCADDEVSPGGLVQECTKCSPDMVSESGECVCGPGTFLSKNKCKKCPVGTFGEDFFGCRKCYPGTFNNKRGQTRCQTCPVGQVSKTGATRCKPCPDGLVPSTASTIGRNSFGPGKCVNVTDHCLPGSERVGRGFETRCQKIICTSSAPAADIGRSCTPCPRGSVLDESGTTTKCVKCPDDSISEGGLQKKCSKCRKGFVRDEIGGKGNRCVCAGEAALGRGVQNGFCKLCPGGSEANANAFVLGVNATCEPCRPGEFKPDSNDPKNFICKPCGPNTFSTGGATECTPCPPGFVTKKHYSSTKASDCVPF